MGGKGFISFYVYIHLHYFVFYLILCSLFNSVASKYSIDQYQVNQEMIEGSDVEGRIYKIQDERESYFLHSL